MTAPRSVQEKADWKYEGQHSQRHLEGSRVTMTLSWAM